MNVYALGTDFLTAPARGTEPTRVVILSKKERGYGMSTQPLYDAHFTAQATLRAIL